METDDNLERHIERSKKRAKWGCLIWACILIVGPIVVIVSLFSYEMYFKESTIVISHSPNNENTIEVVEKGEAAWFGPSSIRIKYGSRHIDRSIGNDGKTIDSSNISVRWVNDEAFVVTLYGEEQEPETVEIILGQGFRIFSEKEQPEIDPFEEVEPEIGSFTFKTSESPNLINIIEFREMIEVKRPSTVDPEFYSIRIYYGKRGSILENYKEYKPGASFTPDNFKVIWESDERVTIDVVRDNEKGETFVEHTIKIDLSK